MKEAIFFCIVGLPLFGREGSGTPVFRILVRALLCIKHKKSNALTGDCRNFKTSTLTRHADSKDHKEAVAAESMAGSFEKTVKKVLDEKEAAVVSALKVVFMPPKELWEAYSNRTVRPSVRQSVRPSRFRVRSISLIFFEVGIPNLVCGYILGWRSVAYHFRVTVTLTLTSDLVFIIIVSGAYLLYYLR